MPNKITAWVDSLTLVFREFVPDRKEWPVSIHMYDFGVMLRFSSVPDVQDNWDEVHVHIEVENGGLWLKVNWKSLEEYDSASKLTIRLMEWKSDRFFRAMDVGRVIWDGKRPQHRAPNVRPEKG